MSDPTLTAPQVCCLPHVPKAFARIARHCRDLGLPAPTRWTESSRGRTIRDLLTAAAAAGPTPVGDPDPDDAPERPPRHTLALPPGAPQPVTVLLLHRVPMVQVRDLIRACRQDGHARPIVAVSTPTSLDFTLATLLEHLAADRAREEAARIAKKADGAA